MSTATGRVSGGWCPGSWSGDSRPRRPEDGTGSFPCLPKSKEGFACESDPGDVAAFDGRLWHASLGGSSDRQMCDITYWNYPRTPQEVAAIITHAKSYLTERDNSAEPWNPKRSAPDEWLANPVGNPRRRRWLDALRKFSEMTEGENGFKTVAIDGKMKIVPA